MLRKIQYGVGAHEPIFHRIRTGNANAEEWARWEREVSVENLDVLERLGVRNIHIACSKGFGLEAEKPLIERAAKFAELATKRGIRTSAYIQGFPIFYETFFLEVPEAIHWLAKNQEGQYIAWGNQTFRRWVDPTNRNFLEYQLKLVHYILEQFTPSYFMMDNTQIRASYSESALASWRKYLENKFDSEQAMSEFGLSSFSAIELPIFNYASYPPDAFQIVKDPLLQEWCYWNAKVVDDFLVEIRKCIKAVSPQTPLYSPAGCDGLRYNQLFRAGVDFESRIDAIDGTWMEEAAWRPGVVEVDNSKQFNKIVLDERVPDQSLLKIEKSNLRVSTDSRWGKIIYNYGKSTGEHGFWGETTREAKLIALSHHFCFAKNADHYGNIGPLCADARMLDDIQDVFDWADKHIDVLSNRDSLYAPISVWRSTNTNAFIRHRPVWEACVVEQILYENHYAFDILLDNGLERFLKQKEVLILPGSACISDQQVELITAFVREGGRLLLIGHAGTRDARTRVRTKHAFSHLFGSALPELEFIGPPHWVPTLDFSKIPDSLIVDYGKGKVALIKQLEEVAPLDLSRDPYMPERQVFVKDIVPPKNEASVLEKIELLGGKKMISIEGPRWVLSEFWRQGNNLLVCLVNLRKNVDGGPIAIHFKSVNSKVAKIHHLLQESVIQANVEDGKIVIHELQHFCAVNIEGYWQ